MHDVPRKLYPQFAHHANFDCCISCHVGIRREVWYGIVDFNVSLDTVCQSPKIWWHWFPIPFGCGGKMCFSCRCITMSSYMVTLGQTVKAWIEVLQIFDPRTGGLVDHVKFPSPSFVTVHKFVTLGQTVCVHVGVPPKKKNWTPTAQSLKITQGPW